ncbi:HK97-gp10 family putative phage morphogenesis protein [uncultured Ramlibacter sp.]|uniref:HK97-gp10 family putative phage morphogenesis protein n=1 Tax=uncultured Ramlibacter sp. TaxID=260755 RepID=UPI00261BAAE6|nr:HK97-gp10 family putative phage morphogenesis protein [uncultured Ramlibacter sp.]
MTIKMDTRSFAASIASTREEVRQAARPAAQAGMQVIYEVTRANAPVSEHEHFFHGKSFKTTGQKYLFQPGNLRDAIYQAFNEKKSGDGFASYSISWNRSKAPYGHMVELGTSRAAAQPFLGPALHSQAGKAQNAMGEEFFRRVRKA